MPALPLVLIASLLFCQVPAEDSPKDLNQLKKRLSEVQMHLTQVDKQISRLSKRRKGVLVELQTISLQSDKIRAQAHGAKLRMDHARNEVSQINTRKASIQKEIARLRNEMKRQVRWTQALGPLGGLALLPSAENFEEFLIRGRYYEFWRNKQQRKLDYVGRLRTDLMERERDLQEALKRLATEEKEASHYQTVLRLSEERLKNYLNNLQLDEKRSKEAQEELAEESIRLERMLEELLGKPKAGAFEAAAAFVSLRGQLPQPVSGRIAQGFGENIHPKFKTKTMQSGILIATEPNATVRAVADGKVIYAESYQSYGPMVVLDHGGGYFSLYTHLNGYHVFKDQVLRQGESLGSAGGTVDGPRLGFEIRYLAQAQDPQKWLKNKY